MKNTDRSVIARSFRAAFPHTIPILAGFLFLGMAYGIYMNVQGFSFVYPMLMAAAWSSWRWKCCFLRSHLYRCCWFR